MYVTPSPMCAALKYMEKYTPKQVPALQSKQMGPRQQEFCAPKQCYYILYTLR